MRVDRSRLPEPGPDRPLRFPSIVHHTLKNGLRVRTVEHPSVPVVTFVMEVGGGLGADPAGREGLASLTADMVDEGTGDLSAIEVSDGFARIGAEYDVDVAPDATMFTLTTLTRFAARGAGLLSRVLTRPAMRESDFDRVRTLRLDRLQPVHEMGFGLRQPALHFGINRPVIEKSLDFQIDHRGDVPKRATGCRRRREHEEAAELT